MVTTKKRPGRFKKKKKKKETKHTITDNRQFREVNKKEKEKTLKVK